MQVHRRNSRNTLCAKFKFLRKVSFSLKIIYFLVLLKIKKMKKVFIMLFVMCSYITHAAPAYLLKATLVGSNIEVTIQETNSTPFNLGTSDFMLSLDAALVYTIGMAPMVNSTTSLVSPFLVDVIEISPGDLGVSILHNSGTKSIGAAPVLIARIPVTGSGAISISGANIFNSAQVAIAPGTVLPTELLTFKGNKKGAVSQLQWEATNEKNLVNYIVERSTDGRNFRPLGFTKPKSFNATEKVAYDFIDDSPEIGINYYRLLSKGFGKDEKYSKVISLDFGLGLSGRVFPNPLDTDLTIELDIEDNTGNVDISIYDVVGKQILSKKIQNSDRRVNMTLPTADLPPGTYLVKVKVGSFNWERQITKM
jgi:Secretion system C-terminal sorting domain